MLIRVTQLKKYIVNERITFVDDRRERPMCRSLAPVNRAPAMIVTWFDIVTPRNGTQAVPYGIVTRFAIQQTAQVHRQGLYAIRHSSGRVMESRQLVRKALAAFSSMPLSPGSRAKSPYWLEVV